MENKNSDYNLSKQKHTKLGRGIFIILMIFWMVLIFAFSSRDAELSTRDSNAVGIFIGQHFVPGFEDWTEQQQLQFAEKIDHPVRKTAHATEYAVLGMLASGAVGLAGLLKRRWWIAWLIAVAYAASDEIHQYFVPGRACMFRDVCIDSAGALAGIVIVLLITRGIRAGRKRRSQKGRL